MKDNKKTYWKGIEQLSNDPTFVKNAQDEFPENITEEPTNGSSRRDFLKMMGFSIAAASLAACEAPVRKAIPYVNKPVDIDPGVANYYASTYLHGGDYCSVVVKTREGRPIKISGNKMSSVTKGGITAQVEASVLSLYDSERLKGPKAKGKNTDWATLDKEVIAKLNQLATSGKQIRIVSNTVLSPTTLKTIEDFKTKFPTTEHVMYDPISMSGIARANEESFGKKIIPSYDFSNADVIVSVAADFLSTWGPIENEVQYGETRKVGEKKKSMSRHYQFESMLSLTGSNADYRATIKPSQEGLVVAQIYNAIATKAGATTISTPKVKGVKMIDEAAKDLWKAKGKALLVSSSNDPAVQVLVNATNDLLGSYGKTIFLDKPVNYRQGSEIAMDQFISDAGAGQVGAVIFYNANPAYDYHNADKLIKSLDKVQLKISTAYVEDETAKLADYIAPDCHYLESWNDASPKLGEYSLSQPTITPIFKTRQAQSSLLTWSGADNTDYFNYLKENWRVSIYNNLTVDDLDLDSINDADLVPFPKFWDQSLHDGVCSLPQLLLQNNDQEEANRELTFAGDVAREANSIYKNYKASNKELELVIYEKSAIGNGSMANNPLLQELPDPITKVTWDNYVTMSITDAKSLNGGTDFMKEGFTRRAEVKVGNKSLNLPVVIQPGQANGTIGIALGYGRTAAGRAGNGLGIDMYPLVGTLKGRQNLSITKGVSVSLTEDSYRLAQTQTAQTFMGRETIIQETTLSEYKKDEGAGRFHPHVATWKSESGQVRPEELTLWQGHDYKGHHWGLSIDLNACNGCSACVVACNVENNIPMVGKEEIINRREMTWLRIDRYYSSRDESELSDSEKGLRSDQKLELAAQNPEVVFQPMMCQHCNNAPCETVCPVAATTHSTEGLNQMTYNRCIGTRYCANNCPYKVRRFNWFKYHDNEQFAKANPQMNTELGKMVLNPDVTVRSRGVMEKCSFCVQNIQLAKLEAKRERRELRPDEVDCACATACSTGALVFGDMNNKKAQISQLLKIEDAQAGKERKVMKNKRAYHVLEEIGVRPNVFYLTKVRNKG